MKDHKYVITCKYKPGKYLAGLGLGSCNHLFQDVWTNYIGCAMRCTRKEAILIIQFIEKVIDKDLGQSLSFTEFKSKEPWEEKGK